jgi:Ca2+-binding RTX toxin-like protein
VEALETRTLLSATLVNGVLYVEGTRRADVIDFSFKLNDPGHIVVGINHGIPFGFRASQVKRIVVNCGLGDDLVNRNPNAALPNEVDKPTTIIGGPGFDGISGNKGDNLIDGQDGGASITTFDGNDTIIGGDGDDSVVAGDGNNVITGGDGRDVLTGGRGNDSISGGAGVDSLEGGGGRDTLRGDANADHLSIAGGVGGILEGGRGDDTLIGNSTSSLFGNAGIDTFFTPVVRLVKDPATDDVIHVS